MPSWDQVVPSTLRYAAVVALYTLFGIKALPAQTKTAGHTLPVDLHGFRLGISPKTALNIAQTRSYSCKDSLWEKTTPCQEKTVIHLETSEKFQVTLLFAQQRLISIESDLKYVDGAHAEQVDADVLTKFGKPDKKSYDPQGDGELSLWIDGDARALYENRSGSGKIVKSRILELQIVTYPDWVRWLESNLDTSTVEWYKKRWNAEVGLN